MAKKLELLKSNREQQFSAIHRIDNFIKNLNLETIDQKTVFELEARSKNLEEIFNKFNSTQSEIEILTKEGEEIRDEFENEYFCLYGEIQSILHDFKTNSKQSVSTPEDSPSLGVPLISLPNFDGNYDKWLQFRDTFTSVVDQHPKLTKIQKFLHLRSCLNPDVLDTIRAIPVCDNNYQLAWQKLKDRYERSHLITNNHVNLILNFPRLRREFSRELRDLHNCIDNNLNSLKALGAQVQHWDLILIPIISSKLDSVTRREWEKLAISKKDVSIQDLLHLINNRSEFLEVLEKEKTNAIPQSKFVSQSLPKAANHTKSSNCFHTQIAYNNCKICEGNHPIFKCDTFLKLPVNERIQKVKQKGLCINCLKSSHTVSKCYSSKCRKCNKSHNTLLHKETEKNVVSHSSAQAVEPEVVVNTQAQFCKNLSFSDQVILPTAIVYIQDSKGEFHKCRALLDNGAMSNFITSEICNKFKLHTKRINCSITGVGQVVQKTQYMTDTTFKSAKGLKFVAQCLVIDKITSHLPLHSFNHQSIQIPDNFDLADPNFNQSGPIDLLLGSSIFWDLLQTGRTPIPRTGLVLQETKLGWIIGGRTVPTIGKFGFIKNSVDCFSACSDPLTDQLRKFWELEEVNAQITLSPEDKFCEELFLTTHKRTQEGKFVVKIPFKSNLNELGHTRDYALKRYKTLENRLMKNKTLHFEYSKIMDEYIKMGHMKLVNDSIDEEEKANYYIPHHAVTREDSLTTKTRIVFDASMKSSSGLSLNDVQHVGPCLQNELFSTLINFRLHRYIIGADISKMYRMVWLHDNDKKFHRIYWREDPNKPLNCFELQTLTFGTASAPYLAIRCLNQLAIENEKLYPKACKIIKNNFYVDDLIYGAETISELVQLQHEISSILTSAGFHLRKWICNEDKIYSQLKLNPNLELNTLQFGNKTNKTLGIMWNSKTDEIIYKNIQTQNDPLITKRIVLSDLAKIFDPLGLLGPVVIIGKILMQNLWKLNLGWDEKIPHELSNQWSSFRNDISNLSLNKIPRRVIISDSSTTELHGFSDASEHAYGACLFIRTINSAGKIFTNLLCAKSRVAPLKSISLPRLELCGALLLARLTKKVLGNIQIQINKVYLWTDSKITLAWIAKEPTHWKSFIANRVSEIQNLTDGCIWRHVSGKENPADVISRGIRATQLRESKLWWSGPPWLTLTEAEWPVDRLELEDCSIPEQRVLFTVNMVETIEIVERYSNLQRVIRITAYCLRFQFNCRNTAAKLIGELTIEELQRALNILLISMQKIAFPQDYSNLHNKKPLHNKSRLLPLNPYLDNNGLIRVGGRLSKSESMPMEAKHPIILDPKHRLSKLLAKQIHFENSHCGPTMLLYVIRQNYWPLNGRNLARQVTRGCTVCFLARPKAHAYIMGDLPKDRVNPAFPFENVGIDYAGPLQIKDRITKNYKTVKAYIALFICLVTKAIHLELVTELTTEGFIACFNRFISRRGRPQNIYSDNGKNFVGASAEIKRVYEFLSNNSQKLYQFLATKQIKWHFIPARTPSFGGLWESNIKRVKYHLITTMKNNKFSYEELYTVLCQIESILNSRPLTPLSADPTDVLPLTPAHFLIGRTFLYTPETAAVTPTSKLKHFHHLQSCLQQFWKRWSLEYMNSLQTREKWRASNDKSLIRVGKVVIIKDEGHAPFQWPLGKITEVHPGSDGIIRVVSVKIGDSVVKRGLSKICPLPEDTELP